MKKFLLFALIISGAALAGQTLFGYYNDTSDGWFGRMHTNVSQGCHRRSSGDDYARSYMMETDDNREWMDLELINRLLDADLDDLSPEEKIEAINTIREEILNELYGVSDDE